MMKNNCSNSARRALALAAVLALLLTSLTGCGGKQDDGDSAAVTASGTVYVPEFTALKTDLYYMSDICASGDYVYFAGEIITGTREDSYPDEYGEPVTYTYDVYSTCLFRLEPESGIVTQLPWQSPEAVETDESSTSSSVYSISPLPDGGVALLQSEYISYYDIPADFDPVNDSKYNYWSSASERYFITFFDAEGQVTGEVTVSDPEAAEDDYTYYYNMCVTADGTVLLASAANIIALDDSGTAVQRVPIDEENYWLNSMCLSSDGTPYCLVYCSGEDGGGYALITPDFTAGTMSEPLALGLDVYSLYTGDENRPLYVADSTNLYSLDPATGETEQLLCWLDLGLYSLSNGAFMADGRIVSLQSDWSGAAPAWEMAVLTETDASLVPAKTELTLACDYLDYYVRRQVVSFNRSSQTARIAVKDYSQYNDYTSEETYTAGAQKLNTEIISGNVPDILVFSSSLPFDTYAAKGILADLWPFIDADSELGGREALVEPFFSALATGESLYRLSPSFYISSAVGAAALVGEDMGWTLTELLDALAQLPEGAQVFSGFTTRDTVLQTAIAADMGSLIDWSTGECSFDSQNFADILELAAMFPAEFDWDNYDWDNYEDEYTRVMSGKQLLMEVSLSDFSTLQLWKAVFGGDITFIGWPAQSGSGSSFIPDVTLGMSAKCENKDAAWKFLRVFLTEDYQNSNTYSFPSNLAAFEAKAHEAMYPDSAVASATDLTAEELENGVIDHYWLNEDMTVDIYPTSQQEYEQVLALINATENIQTYYTDIMSIINDACAPFFNGQDTAENAAKQVQSRVKLYVAEQS